MAQLPRYGIKVLQILRGQISISLSHARAHGFRPFYGSHFRPRFLPARCFKQRPEDVGPSALMPISHVGNWTRHKNFSVEKWRGERKREKERDKRETRERETGPLKEKKTREDEMSEQDKRMIRPVTAKKRKKRSLEWPRVSTIRKETTVARKEKESEWEENEATANTKVEDLGEKAL